MKILVVDDEIDVKPLFEQRFRKEIRNNQIAFVFKTSGEEAFTYLKEHTDEGFSVLSDINMPGMSGLELLKEIKEKFASPPPVVMMVTAYSDSENYNQAMSLGADDFLSKPIDFNLLKKKLKII
jgi:CheY-like chemotaxis protein